MNKKYIKPAIIKIKVCKANVIATSGPLGVSSNSANIGDDGIVEMEGKSRDDDFFSDEDVDF